MQSGKWAPGFWEHVTGVRYHALLSLLGAPVAQTPLDVTPTPSSARAEPTCPLQQTELRSAPGSEGAKE